MITGIFEVFWQPGKLFDSLNERRAAWVFPLLLNILLSVAATMAVVQLIGMETIIRQRFAGSSRISPEQMQQIMSRANSPGQVYASYGGAAVSILVGALVLAGILKLFATMSNRQPAFGTMFSMVNLSLLPYLLVNGLMTTLVLLFAPDRPALDITNLLATNPAAFMDKAKTSAPLYSFLSSLDVVSLAGLFLMSYAFAKVTKTSVSAGLGAVGVLWLVFVFAKVCLSMLF